MTASLLKTAEPISEDWPELVPLDTPNLPRIDLSHLPNWAGNFAKALSAHTETPPELATGMILITSVLLLLRVDYG